MGGGDLLGGGRLGEEASPFATEPRELTPMRTVMPEPKDIDGLISFLPRLYDDGSPAISKWHGGPGQGGDLGVLPYPEYPEVVKEFFRAASADCWSDYQYVPADAKTNLEKPGFVESADLNQIKTVLTYCVRGERFCVGFWRGMVDDGYIRRILERLAQLRSQMF